MALRADGRRSPTWQGRSATARAGRSAQRRRRRGRAEAEWWAVTVTLGEDFDAVTRRDRSTRHVPEPTVQQNTAGDEVADTNTVSAVRRISSARPGGEEPSTRPDPAPGDEHPDPAATRRRDGPSALRHDQTIAERDTFTDPRGLIEDLVAEPPAATRGVPTGSPHGAGEWRHVLELADPAAGLGGRVARHHHVLHRLRLHPRLRRLPGPLPGVGRNLDLFADDDSFAPWNPDTSATFGTHVELGPGLLIRSGFIRVDGGVVPSGTRGSPARSSRGVTPPTRRGRVRITGRRP